MARVVTRRSGTPYLLVVFVFLFVIAAALAVLGFMQRDEAKELSAAREDELADRNNRLSELEKNNEDLVQLVTGRSGTAVSARKQAEQVYAQLDERPGLAPEVLILLEKVKGLQAGIQERNAQTEQLNKQLQAKEDSISKLQETIERKVGELTSAKDTLVDELETERQTAKEAINEIKGEMAALREKLEKDILAKEKKIEELLMERQKKQEDITELMKQMRDLKAKLNPQEATVANEADGRIEKIATNADVCYIDIGSKDRVQPGMTFAVYGPNPANAEEVKGSMLVSNVSENFSECRILQQDKDHPLAVGDTVANLAFHAVRTYVFTVFGEFDLHGTNNPTRYGTEEVKAAIQKFGGKLSDSIGIQTDYVVMGAEPQRPEEPAPDAGPSVQKAYQLQLQEYNQYNKAIELAESLKIPILNTNRFLILTGYEPATEP
jgi:hypothetical protein